MKALKKGIRFWGKLGGETLLSVGGLGLFLTLFIGAGSGEGIREIAVEFPLYLLISAGFLLAIITFNIFQIYMPIVISMGGRRKEGIWGMVLMMFGVIGLCGLISWGVWTLLPGEKSLQGIQTLPTLLTENLLASALSLVFVGISVRYGKFGRILLILLCAVMGGVIGLLSAFGRGQDLFKILVKFADNPPYVLLAGAGAFLLAGWIFWRLDRNMEVRI